MTYPGAGVVYREASIRWKGAVPVGSIGRKG